VKGVGTGPPSPTPFTLLPTPWLDEALAVREWRRAQRWLLRSGVPLLYVIGTILLPWLVLPGIFYSVSSWSGQSVLQSQPRWMFMTLALSLVGGAMATAFARVSQVWQSERVQQTLEGWFLSRQQSGPLVFTAALSGAALALMISLPGAVLLAAVAILSNLRLLAGLLTFAFLILGAALAAATASAAFFATTVGAGRRGETGLSPRKRERGSNPLLGAKTAPAGGPYPTSENAKGIAEDRAGHFRLPFADTLLSRFRGREMRSTLASPYTLALGAVLLLVLALWLRIEAVERGWARPWEEHPGRLLLAAGLLTPAPAILGISNRRWWVYRVVERLDFPITPEAAATLLLLLYAVGTLALLHWSERSYRLLRDDPERDRRASPSAADDGEITESETRGYWAGFGNPVWTRELRTRLRGREAPQFIFLASVTLAIGGFAPLVSAAGQLGDPLQTAAVAREVFFWLAMTLIALIALVTPGLTAEAVGAERARGSLELLLATPLRPQEILCGKLLGDLSVMGLLVSPSLPLFGFCYLFHGASWPQVLGVFLVLGLTALLSGMFGVTASALHARTLPAKWQAYLLSLLFSGLPGGPFWLMAALASPSSGAGGTGLISPVLLALCGFLLAGLWSNACDRLEYAEL
jgi:ABC-type transport system involved in cytochrome c biogenesis permease component